MRFSWQLCMLSCYPDAAFLLPMHDCMLWFVHGCMGLQGRPSRTSFSDLWRLRSSSDEAEDSESELSRRRRLSELCFFSFLCFLLLSLLFFSLWLPMGASALLQTSAEARSGTEKSPTPFTLWVLG